MAGFENDIGNNEQAPFAGAAAQAETAQPALLQVLWRRRWIVAISVVLSISGAFWHLSRVTPLYTSTSQVYVEKSGPKIITDSTGVMTQSYNYLHTQKERLRSTPILASALEQPGMRELRTLRAFTNPLGFLKSALETEVGKKDEIIRISLELADADEAATIVNAVVDAYITFHSTQKRHTAAEVLRTLQSMKSKRDVELASKLKAMLDYKQSNVGLAYETKDGNVITERLARFSDALTGAQLATIDAESGYEASKAMLSDPSKMQQLMAASRARGGGAAGQGEVARLQAEIGRLELQLLEMRRSLTDTHPAFKVTQDKIEELEKRLPKLVREAAETEVALAAQRLAAAQQKEAKIRAFFEEQREEAQGLNVQLAEFMRLRSDWEQTKKLCDILDERIKEINVTEDTGALNITILEVASPGTSPTSPNRTRTMAMALVLGAMLGVGLALGRDWLDQRFRSADEISATLGAPILGIVPAMNPRQSLALRGRKVIIDSTSHAAEAYRTIRTAIYFGVPNGDARTLLVTSPAPGDGKTTLVSNLGLSMAQAGQRTLIIDADFRKPMQHNIFEVERDRGLSDVLAGGMPFDSVVHHTDTEGLDLLPCGPTPPNPSEIINSRAFADLLKGVSETYDRVLVDSPPVMPVTDARILGAMCDVTILVVHAGKSHRKVAQRARDGLLSVGSRLLGVVVNAVPRSEDRYYHYSSYGYYYRHGYGGGYGYGANRDRAREMGDPARNTSEREDVTG